MQWLLALTALGYAASTVTRLLSKMAISRGDFPALGGLTHCQTLSTTEPGPPRDGRHLPSVTENVKRAASEDHERRGGGRAGHQPPWMRWFGGPFRSALLAGPLGLALAGHLGAGALLLMGGAAPEHFSSRAAFLLAAGVLAAVCAALEWSTGETFFSIFGLPVAAILVGFAGLSEQVWQNPLFERPWFLAHVAAAVAGECFFLMAAVSAGTYLFMVRRLKSKNRVRALQVLPPLAQLDQFTVLFLRSGVAAFGLGIAIGAWGWIEAFGLAGLLAPKKMVSAAALVFFAGLLAARRQQWVVGPRWSMLTIAGVIASLSVLLVDRGTHWSAP